MGLLAGGILDLPSSHPHIAGGTPIWSWGFFFRRPLFSPCLPTPHLLTHPTPSPSPHYTTSHRTARNGAVRRCGPVQSGPVRYGTTAK